MDYIPRTTELKSRQLCHVKNNNEWNKNPGQAEPRNARNIHAYLLVWLDSVIGGQSWGENEY